MDRRELKGSITIFLSMVCIFFLCLICTAVESARVQGAKAQTANITGMGNFSVLSEFEKPLLEDYDIFALDGSYGSGSFKIRKVEERLEHFLSCNTNPKEGVFSVWCFDPWNLELTDSEIKEYALLTDDKGEPFYQQAVSFMKTNAASLAIGPLLDSMKDADKVKEWGEEYEKRKNENDDQMSGLEGERKEKLDQLESEAQESGTAVVPATEQNNPLKEIAKLRKKSILDLVTGGKAVSEKKISACDLPSKSSPRKGTLKLERENKGTLSDVLFREYLLLYFPNYLSEKKEGAADYQVEYLLGGKVSDKLNLKYVVNRLLLIREGMNYLYCLEDAQMSNAAGGLALALTGFLGIPALTTATKHALLLAWAYGESLIDVRTLLEGGKVPLLKDASSWTLSLENLGKLLEILAEGKTGHSEGLQYKDYLRILLNLGKLSNQKLRALDMIQCSLRQKKGTGKFLAENCIVAVKSEMEWECKPVFFSLPQAVMGLRGKNTGIKQSGSLAY